MTEREFNKQKNALIANIDKAKTFEDKLIALDEFQYFMRTKSCNGHWNPKYRKNRYILLPNGEKIPWEFTNIIF